MSYKVKIPLLIILVALSWCIYLSILVILDITRINRWSETVSVTLSNNDTRLSLYLPMGKYELYYSETPLMKLKNFSAHTESESQFLTKVLLGDQVIVNSTKNAVSFVLDKSSLVSIVSKGITNNSPETDKYLTIYQGYYEYQ